MSMILLLFLIFLLLDLFFLIIGIMTIRKVKVIASKFYLFSYLSSVARNWRQVMC